jgi:hypothetical protein
MCPNIALFGFGKIYLSLMIFLEIQSILIIQIYICYKNTCGDESKMTNHMLLKLINFIGIIDHR